MVMEDSSYLPLYSRRPGPTRQPRRETPISPPRSSSSYPHKCVHVIPLTLLLSLSILWWFSHPVNWVVIKDGKLVEIVPIEIRNGMLSALNDTNVELAILTSAMSPITSTPLNLVGNIDETESLQVSKLD